MENENEAVEAEIEAEPAEIEFEPEYLSIQDEFEADTILFSELDLQAQNEVETLAEFGYGSLEK